MNGFEDRLRAAMQASVAGEEAPPGLMERIRRRHRRHVARVAVAATAVLLAGAAAIVPTRAALLGHGTAPGGESAPHADGPAPHLAAPVGPVRGQHYGCTSVGVGTLGPHWRQDAAHAGPLWFINNGIAPGFRFRTKSGMFKAVPIIAAVPDNTTAWVTSVGRQGRHFRFLPAFNSTNRYRLRDGKAEATFTGCSGPPGSTGKGFTGYYFGVIVAGPRCITLDVRTMGTAHPARTTLRFGSCTT